MQATARVALGISLDDVEDTEVTILGGDYFHSTVYCPEGDWLRAQFEFELKKNCSAQAIVTREIADAVDFADKKKPAKNAYLVEIVSPVSCSR